MLNISALRRDMALPLSPIFTNIFIMSIQLSPPKITKKLFTKKQHKK